MKPWVVLVTGVNGIRKTSTVYQVGAGAHSCRAWHLQLLTLQTVPASPTRSTYRRPVAAPCSTITTPDFRTSSRYATGSSAARLLTGAAVLSSRRGSKQRCTRRWPSRCWAAAALRTSIEQLRFFYRTVALCLSVSLAVF